MLTEERLANMSRVIAGYHEIEVGGAAYQIRDHSFLHEHDAQSHYTKSLQIVGDGGLTEEFRLEFLRDKDLWNDKLAVEMENLIKHQKILQTEIKNCEFKSKQKQRLIATLEANKKRVEEISNIEGRLSSFTVENFARVEKYKRLLFLVTYKDDKRLWKNWGEFEDENVAFITYLINKAFFSERCGEKEIRDIARNEPWRSLWKSANGRDSLFGKPVVEYSLMQRELVYWSLVYDSVFDSPDCPADEIIQNDDALDAWFMEQAEKRKSKGKSTEIQNSKIANSQAVGIFVDSQDDAEKVYNLNDPVTKGKIKQRDQFIAQKGKVSEVELPDAKQEIQMKKNQMAAQNIKGRK